jgi:heme A synthase
LKTLRRSSIAALVIALAHLVFGGIVRISGSGMGCGDHWPKCHGQWFPPLNRPDLIIELSHRYLALFLILSISWLAWAAWQRRAEPGVGGSAGVMKTAIASLVVVLVTAGFGAVTVFFGNPAWATVIHWVLAATLLALVAVTVVRTGALGGAGTTFGGGSVKTARVAFWAAIIALLAIAMGGLTAKVHYASIACPSFPLCGPTPPQVEGGAVHVQLTHRVLAFVLWFHLLGAVMAIRKRKENRTVTKAAWIAFGMVTLQLLVAGAMIGMKLPPMLRGLHQATGVAVWLTSFLFYYLARRAVAPR